MLVLVSGRIAEHLIPNSFGDREHLTDVAVELLYYVTAVSVMTLSLVTPLGSLLTECGCILRTAWK